MGASRPHSRRATWARVVTCLHMDARVSAAQYWLKEHESELISDLQALLRIPTLEEPALPNAPFGQPNREALDLMLDLAVAKGMTIKDIEGYAGYAEIGTGEKMIMSLGHLDVVPVGPGWRHQPFGAEIDGEYLYGRGTSDDKGPTMAMFYAIQAVHATLPNLDVRIRNVFGCNEESGFKCVHRYMETEEAPTFGVAPDGGWPCVHAEKGIANFVVECPLPQGGLTLLEIKGGQRPNIVIDSCHARVQVSSNYRPAMEEKVLESWDRNLVLTWEGDVLSINAYGKAAHGAGPYNGDNAAIRVLRFLRECAPISQDEVYEHLFNLPHIGGNGMGISGSDEVSGPLTLNFGIVETLGNKIHATLNVRYPVTWNGEELRARAEAFLAKLNDGYRLAEFENSPPLHFPKDHPLTQTISEVYTAETGENPDLIVMGGGTYARAVPNTIAIGTGWAGDGPAHETDERAKISNIHKASRIYAHLLIRLIDLAKA